MKPIDIKSSTYIDYGVENNDKTLKFKVDYHERVWKYKRIFAKDYTLNWTEGVYVIKKDKNAVALAYVIENFNGEEVFGTYQNKLQNKRVEKVIQRKGNNCMSNEKAMMIRLIVGLIKHYIK